MKCRMFLKGFGIAVSGWLLTTAFAQAQGSAFTYQGRLLGSNGALANGNYDLQFKLHPAASGTNQIGATLTNAPTAVSSSLFTVTLDFGGGAFNGSPRWLEIGVRTNGSAAAYDILSPTQPLSATPY